MAKQMNQAAGQTYCIDNVVLQNITTVHFTKVVFFKIISSIIAHCEVLERLAEKYINISYWRSVMVLINESNSQMFDMKSVSGVMVMKLQHTYHVPT